MDENHIEEVTTEAPKAILTLHIMPNGDMGFQLSGKASDTEIIAALEVAKLKVADAMMQAQRKRQVEAAPVEYLHKPHLRVN